MRFSVILVSVPVLATLAAGLAIPVDVNVEARGLHDAADAHKKTTHLPDRQSTFHVPGAPAQGKPEHTYTGHEVRKAVFDGHKEADRLAQPGMSKTQAKKSPMKSFNNYPHQDPHPHGVAGDRPLPHMHVVKGDPAHPPGREFPLPNHHDPHNPSPARVITQQMPGGHHQFQGVIAHDQSRAPGTSGYNDHFHVPEHKKT